MKNKKTEIEDNIEQLLKSDKISQVTELLLNEYGPRALKILKNARVKDEHERISILHDTIIVFIQKFVEGKVKSNFQSYFNTICVNKGLDYRKSFVKRNFISKSIDFFVNHFNTLIHNSMNGTYLPREVKIALKKLSRECQDRIKYYFFEEKTHAEIAALYDNTGNANVSRVQLARCLDKLRDLIETVQL